MLASMTGYGHVAATSDFAKLEISVHALNAKSLEVNCRLPILLQEQEMVWRKKIAQHLVRGKVTLTMSYMPLTAENQWGDAQQKAFQFLYHQLEQLCLQTGKTVTVDTLFTQAMQLFKQQMPPVPEAPSSEAIDWVEQTLEAALRACKADRLTEGAALGKQLRACYDQLKVGLERIEAYDPQRFEQAKKSLRDRLVTWTEGATLHAERLEDAIVLYTDRLDIAEEKTRLRQHLNYFDEIYAHADEAGKKLSFLTQEIGREINTIGAKAGDAQLQHWVVEMKHALGQMKEQLANVL